MLILKTLTLQPLHGYGIGVRLEQISEGGFQVQAGSLFPALRRLERNGLISGEWRVTENNRQAKYSTSRRTDLVPKCRLREVRHFKTDHGQWRRAEPPTRRRARNTVSRGDG